MLPRTIANADEIIRIMKKWSPIVSVELFYEMMGQVHDIAIRHYPEHPLVVIRNRERSEIVPVKHILCFL